MSQPQVSPSHQPPVLHPEQGGATSSLEEITASEADDVDECFERLRHHHVMSSTPVASRSIRNSNNNNNNKSLREASLEASPLPRAPETAMPPCGVCPGDDSQGGTPTPSALRMPSGTTHHVVNLPLSSSFVTIRALWHSPWRWHVVLLLTLSAVVVALWERQLFDSLANSDADPPLVIVAVVLGKGVSCALLLLASHAFFGIGLAAERFLFSRPLVVGISASMFGATVLAGFSMSALTWPSAVIVNPLAFAPLFYLMLSTCVGAKRLPRSAFLIVSAAVVAMCVGLIRGIADSAMTTDDGHSLGEGAGCLIALASGALMGLSFALMERHVMHYPTSALYVASVCGFAEVLYLPLVMVVDMMPVFGSSSSAQAALGRFFSLHRSQVPSSLVALVVAHTVLVAVAIPLLTRCPSFLVPLFSGGPLLAAVVYPGPSLPVLIGGVYAVLVVILLLVSEAEYDEDVIATIQQKVRVLAVPGAGGGYLWRHGCSVVCWRPMETHAPSLMWSRAAIFAERPSAWRRALVEAMCMVGWVPLSAAFPGYVRYSSSVKKATRRDRYGYSVMQMTGMNTDD